MFTEIIPIDGEYSNMTAPRQPLNTDQRQASVDLTGYRLVSVDYRTGRAVIESPRMRTLTRRYQYTVFLYQPPAGKRQCDCPGHRAYGRCRHSGVNGIAWGLCWADAEGQSPLRGSVGSVFSDFMDSDHLTPSEWEADFRQSVDLDAAVFQVLWGGLAA